MSLDELYHLFKGCGIAAIFWRLYLDVPDSQKWALIYMHFEARGVLYSDILAAIAYHLDQAEKAEGKLIKLQQAEPLSQLEADLAEFRRYCRQNGHLSQFVKSDGSPNISAVCRAIGVSPGGAGWQRGLDLVDELKRRATKRRLSPPERTWRTTTKLAA